MRPVPKIFNVPEELIAPLRADHAVMLQLGGLLSEKGLSVQRHSGAAAGWDTWLKQASAARITLPYSSLEERLSGRFPSFLPEEQKLVLHILSKKSEEWFPQNSMPSPATRISLGAPGAGKSTLLKELSAQETPGALCSDPDEGVLENLGPYLAVRHLLRDASAAPDPNLPPDLRIKAKNEWRLPPYNAFRGASNVINTLNTGTGLARGWPIEFHWTGAGAFGLRMINEGYKPAGRFIDMVMEVTSYEQRLMREERRQRPATEEDFRDKAVDCIKLLPQSLLAADHFRLFDGDPLSPRLVFEAYRDIGTREMKVFGKDPQGIAHVLANMEADIARTQKPDPAIGEGLVFLRGLLALPLAAQAQRRERPTPRPSGAE